MNDTAPTIHVHAPAASGRELFRFDCPTCPRRVFALAWCCEWYGATVVCLRCGERFSDGEQLERPFMRGWRKKSIEAAKEHWREGPAVGGLVVPEIEGDAASTLARPGVGA